MKKEINFWQVWWIVTILGILLLAICDLCGMPINPIMKKRKYWYVKWEGTTVYETWYDDSCYFDNNEEALDFIIKLKKDENIKRIELTEHTVWDME